MKTIVMLAALLFTAMRPASAESVNYVEMNVPAAAFQVAHDVNVGDFRALAVQVDYSAIRPSTVTFYDGDYSSTTFRVSNFDALHGRPSSGTITLVSGHNVALGSATVTVKGRVFKEGESWNFNAVYATMTAKSIQTAIDGHDEYRATVSSNVITVWALSTGTVGNAYGLSTSSPAALSVSSYTLSNGVNFATITINGVRLVEGNDFTAQTSSHVTANAIAVAINANATLPSMVRVSSSANTGILTIISSYTGVNQFHIDVTTPALLVSDFIMYGGSASSVDVNSDRITVANHRLSEGLKVLYQKSSGTDPTGLVSGTTYFVHVVSTNAFQLATSSSSSGVGTAVNVTALTGAGRFVLSPLAFSAGSTGFDWRGSNDGSTYYALPLASVSSVTYSADGGGLWTFTDYAYKYLRFNFTAPAAGGLNLNLVVNGRK
jgi:hypothetical protein